MNQINENHSQSIDKLSTQLAKVMEILSTRNRKENTENVEKSHQLGAHNEKNENLSNTGHQYRAIPKLSNISVGPDENIEVWITPFDESLHFLSDIDKLQEMLPKFRDIASDFVFGQLTYAERSDLIKTVETPRMFQMHFDKRKQTDEESYHDFGCDLKRLYGKAYPRRPWYVRNEDLVRKFLSCIMDKEAGGQIEYHKCRKTIDHERQLITLFMK